MIINLSMIPPVQRTHPRILFEQPAEIPLILIPDHLADLLHGQLRVVGQVMFCLGQPHLGDEFQRGHLVLLLEDPGQVAGAVVHAARDQVQIDVHIIILDQVIPQGGGDLLRGVPGHGLIENVFVSLLLDLILLPDVPESQGQFFRIYRL